MSVQHAVLGLTASWQKTIAVNLAKWNAADRATPSLYFPDQAGLDQMVTELILVVLCLHLCEFRQIAGRGQLQQAAQQAQPYKALCRLWQDLCNRSAQRFTLLSLPCPSLLPEAFGHLFDRLLQSLLSSLYYPDAEQYAVLPISILGQVYEQAVASNSSGTRKTGGVYYTPSAIVDYVVKATLERFTKPPLLLDPACGGGAFLVTAYRYLLNHYPDDNSANLLERQNLLQCVHGTDIDQTAVNVTKLSLWLTLLESAGAVQLPRLPDLDQTIRWGNAVVADRQVDPLALDWPTAFPQVQQGFDLVLGNPPFLDAELMTLRLLPWRTYCAQHYQTATGNWDLFCVFIEKALQLCRPGGITSFVVPNKLLTADYAGAARQLLSRTCLWTLRDYSQLAAFSASVYPVVYLSENSLGQTSATQYEQMQTLERVGLTYPIHLPPDSPAPWLVAVQTHADLIQQLERFPRLGELTAVTGAATVAEAYQLQGLIRDCAQPAPDDLRLVNSGTIDRYRRLWGQKPMRYLGQSYTCPVVAAAELGDLLPKRLYQARQAKIIVAGMGLRLESILDRDGSLLAGKSTAIVNLPPRDPESQRPLDPHFLLGLLNSRLLSFYLLTRFGGNRLQGGYLRIGSSQLRQLPIALPAPGKTELHQQIIQLVQQRLQPEQSSLENAAVNLEIQQIDREIDQLVYKLYQLEDAEIALVEEVVLAP